MYPRIPWELVTDHTLGITALLCWSSVIGLLCWMSNRYADNCELQPTLSKVCKSAVHAVTYLPCAYQV
jgi:hypothetical protein